MNLEPTRSILTGESGSPPHLKLLIIFSLILATFVTFEQVRTSEFLNFDDTLYVTHNPIVKSGLTPRGVIWAFTTGYASNWHPLTWLSHMLDCELYGLRPGPHHLTSLWLHIATTLLLFLVLKSMTGELWKSSFGAALFALHPLHVESVAWVAERKDVLSTFFWMLTLWTYLRYVERPGLNRYAAVLASFVLGLLSKPMLVTLPFVLLLLDYWPLGRIRLRDAITRKFVSTSLKTPQESRGRCTVHSHLHPPPSKRKGIFANVILEKIPLFILSGASSAITFWVQGKGGAVGSLEEFPFGTRVANALISYVRYIEKMVWPGNLSVFYPYQDPLPAWQAAGAALLLICASILLLRAARKRAYLAVGWLWYLGTLVPVIGLVKIGLHAMADRYTYVPLIGLFIMVAMGVPDLLPEWPHRKVILAVSAGLIVSVLIILTRSQVMHWRNNITLYEHALNVTPKNSLAHANLGAELASQGKLQEAIFHYTEALRIQPNNANAHVNLGLALAQQGRFQDALAHFSETLRTNPRDADAHYNLGLILARQGRYQEAIVHFSEALQVNPTDPDVNYNLALALICQGNDQEAVSRFAAALRIDPGSASANYNMGLTLARLGKEQEAVFYYAKALQANPHAPEVHHDMGIALARQGKFQEAVFHFDETLRIKPRHARAHYNLGLALTQQGKDKEALAQYAEALKINPDDADAQNNTGVSLARLGRYQEAIPHFAEAVRIRPDFSEARLSLALAHLRIGNRSRALEQYKILKKADPEMAKALGKKISE